MIKFDSDSIKEEDKAFNIKDGDRTGLSFHYSTVVNLLGKVILQVWLLSTLAIQQGPVHHSAPDQ